MARKNPVLFPGWRLSPDGKEYKLFDRAEDVPEGWLRETPEGFEKRHGQQSITLGARPPERLDNVEGGVPKKRGRPAKAKDDGALDL